MDPLCGSLGPMQHWFREPIISCPKVGQDIIEMAHLGLQSKADPKPPVSCYVKFLALSESQCVLLCYLNVGRHHLVGSLSAVLRGLVP